MNRRLRVLLGLGAAFVIAVVLVAPVALRGGGSPCAQRLAYVGGTYTARPVPADAFVQAEAIGTGVVSGCGATPKDVDIRTIEGVSPALAVGLPTETATLYVRAGRCSKATTLVACLKKRP